MEGFRKTIAGLDFSFEANSAADEIFYHVETENNAFAMMMDKNGKWRIKGKVPFWIKEVEDELGEAIESYNE